MPSFSPRGYCGGGDVKCPLEIDLPNSNWSVGPYVELVFAMLLSRPSYLAPTLPVVLSTKPLVGRGLYETRLKRFIDVALTIALIVLAAPLMVPMLLVAFALVSLDGHPPIFCQWRVGRGHRVYRMLKIRTMVADADVRLDAHLASDPVALAEWSRHQKLRHDPRVTWIGAWLRRTSLDELPQLWNVLRGDMSLVGPRPFMVTQAALYSGASYPRMRPGMTGLWQVSARHESSFAERGRIDDSYCARLGLITDLKILRRTLGVVLRGRGC